MTAPLPPLVAPLRAERYAALQRLGVLIAPPYDVISSADHAALARSPENIVHVILPEGNGDPYQKAAATLLQWRRTMVLVRERKPGVFVLRQEFRTPDGRSHAPTGVFAAVAAEPYGTRRVRPHERNHEGARADRLAPPRATKTMLESILLPSPDHAGGLRELPAGDGS